MKRRWLLIKENMRWHIKTRYCMSFSSEGNKTWGLDARDNHDYKWNIKKVDGGHKDLNEYNKCPKIRVTDEELVKCVISMQRQGRVMLRCNKI